MKKSFLIKNDAPQKKKKKTTAQYKTPNKKRELRPWAILLHRLLYAQLILVETFLDMNLEVNNFIHNLMSLGVQLVALEVVRLEELVVSSHCQYPP
jgi:hypothetical protein